MTQLGLSVDPISLLTTVVCTHPAGWGEVLSQTLTPLQWEKIVKDKKGRGSTSKNLCIKHDNAQNKNLLNNSQVRQNE